LEKSFLIVLINYLLEAFGYEIAPIIVELEKAAKRRKGKKYKTVFRSLENSFQPNFKKIARAVGVSSVTVAKIYKHPQGLRSSFHAEVNKLLSEELMQFDNLLKNDIQLPLLPYNKEIIRLFDIEFNLSLVNIASLSQASGFSYAYTYKLLSGEKKNPTALWKLRHIVVNLYGSFIKHIPYESKLKTDKAA
jgi:hypothetical protein